MVEVVLYLVFDIPNTKQMVEAGPVVVVEVWDQDIVKDNLT